MIALFAILCLLLLAAAAAMALRNLIHSALLLTLNWVGIAGFYLWAGAEFVAFAQVLVYVGAVSMIVLFAVLLTRHSRDDVANAGAAAASWSRVLWGLGATALVGGVLGGAVIATEFPAGSSTAPAIPVKRIGELLMGSYAAALLIVGVLLTVALIGAVIIAAQDRGEETE